MVSDNETVAEIVKRVRRECNSYPLPTAAAEMLKLVREIEAAHKRDIAELVDCLKDARKDLCKGCRDMGFKCGKNKMSGPEARH